MLNQDQIHNKWTEIKGGIRNIWGRISSEELDQINEDLSAVPELVERKYTESKDTINNKMKMLMDSFDNDTDKGFDPDVSSYERSPVTPKNEHQVSAFASGYGADSYEHDKFQKTVQEDEQRQAPRH